MAQHTRPVLGIDIHQSEIRVVEMRPGATAPQIVRAGTVPVPRGGIEGDRIAYPDVVADALRGLLQRMRVGTRAAVVGVSATSAITRVLEIPNVPDAEVPMVIEGELAHYQILRQGSGAFDWVRLPEPDATSAATPQVLLVAAEARVIEDLRGLCERADIEPVAYEPALLALLRAAHPAIQSAMSALCLSLTYGRAEIAIVDHGNIRLYRRLDHGTDSLVAGRRPRSPFDAPEDEVREPVLLNADAGLAGPATGMPPAPGSAFDQAAASALATEVQRSLDYYRREFPAAASVGRIIVATNDPEAADYARWLAQALQAEVTLAEPPVAMGATRAIASQMEAPEGLRFLAAAGLAMHQADPTAQGIPRFNLDLVARADPASAAARRRLAGSGVLTALLALLGIVAIVAMQMRVRDAQHNLDHLRSELLGKRQVERQRLDALRAQREQLAALRGEGLPVPRIMDLITSSLDPRAGLTEVNFDRAGRMSLAGDATNEQAMIRSLESLKNCPWFVGTSLDSFSSKQIDAGKVVEFRVSSTLAGMPGVPSAPAGNP